MRTALEVRPRGRWTGDRIDWTSCQPFVENSRAVLIHRPRFVSLHKVGPKWPAHLAVGAWCGNTMTGTKKFTFLDEPPGGRIVCARCEEAATEAGFPASSQIVGRHVCTGGVVAVNRCCAATDKVTL